MRYQALGAACSAGDVNRLLLAHHADDQAETVLTRLSTGHKMVGLRGMYGFNQIPECWGIHGAHESGGYEAALAGHRRTLSNTGSDLHWDALGQRDQKILSCPPLFETGGVRIMRPLLKIRKQDLIDTCLAHGVAWSEDVTNRDTWRTPRNATRSLLANDVLPSALRTNSLLRLSSRMEAREVQHNQYAAHLNELCQILLFDLRSGSLVVRLPREPITKAWILDAARKGLPLVKALPASMLVQRLVRLLTPYEDVPLPSLKNAVKAMFPTLDHLESINVDKGSIPSSFTSAGVLFVRIHSPLLDTNAKSSPDVGPYGGKSQNQDPDTEFIWSLTRQPFANTSASIQPRGSGNAPGTILIDKILPNKNDALAPSLWSPWRLWDGRYWIRVKNQTNQPLILRHFKESDLHAIRANVSQSKRKRVEELLASAAPNKVRWTLPTIAYAIGENKDIQLGKVLALPSLGEPGAIDVDDEQGRRTVEWKIRYKCIAMSRAKMNMDMVTSWEDSRESTLRLRSLDALSMLEEFPARIS